MTPFRFMLLSGTAVALLPNVASAQTGGTPAPAPATSPDDLDSQDIIVTGIRASLRNSIEVKRTANQVVDVISSEDVGKLPDVNVADALQRVTGVQLTRSFGEGSRINIRGLQAIRVELDGRATYGQALESSPGDSAGRNSGLEQISSTLISRIEVFKTPTAGQIEGGLGGVVNIRTNKPFDFSGTKVVASAEGSKGNLADKYGYSVTGLFSTRLLNDTLGVLVSASYQDNPIGFEGSARQAFVESTGATAAVYDLNGDGLRDLRVNNVRSENFQVDRRRLGLSGNITYRPTDSLELYADATYSKLQTNRYTVTFNQNFGTAAVTNPMFVGNYIVSGTSTTQAFSNYTDRREPTSTLVGGIGGKLTGDRVILSGELAYSRSEFDQAQNFFQIRTTAATPITSTYDLRGGGAPTLSPDATGLTRLASPSSWEAGAINRGDLHLATTEKSGRLDAEFPTEGGLVKSIKVGIRYAGIHATRDLTDNTSTSGVATPSGAPALFRTIKADQFSSYSNVFPNSFISADPEAVRTRSPALFGTTVLVPNATQFYVVNEETYAGYAEANLESSIAGLPFRGNVGVRVIETSTEAQTISRQVLGAMVTLRPRTDKNLFTDVLPSANIAFDLRDDLLLRFSAAKTLARQALADLAPNFQVGATAPFTVTGGNAGLLPTRVKQADATLEYYFGRGRTNLASVALFYKDADGFPVRLTTTEVLPGLVDLVGTAPVLYTRPINSGKATIKGFELNYQQSFDFLPGALDGLGVIANFTYADGKDQLDQPIVGLSRTSYNVTGFFEKYGLNARVSYVWRSSRLFGFTDGTSLINATTGLANPGATGRRFNYVGSTGTLDASVSYDITPSLNVYASGSNLLFTDSANNYYETVPDAQNRLDINERRLSVGARIKF